MSSIPIYAQLADRVYAAERENRTPVPGGWSELDWIPDRWSGFSAGIYKNGNEIVIAFTGTNGQKAADFGWANLLAATGVPSPQVTEAMLLYLQIKQANPTASITFTGHSLGGGLASMMSIFFDRPATVFDAAPFELGARNLLSLAYYKAVTAAAGYSDAAFDAYWAAAPTVFYAREPQVTNTFLKGEFLEPARTFLTEIGTSIPVDAGVPTGVSAFDLHSMTLLAAMLTSDAFKSAVQGIPSLIATLFDGSLFATDAETSRERDFLTSLYRAQVAASDATPLLDLFAGDLQRLQSPDGIVAQASLQRALTVAAMEYYYYKDPASATKLFTLADGGLHFKYSDIGATTYKSLPRLANAIQVYLTSTEAETATKAALIKQDAWHLQSGTSGLVWTATDSSNDAVVGGAGVDIVNAGAGDDLIITGAGSDFLTGGAGRDSLLGGLGFDSYQYAVGDGNDVITDADGDGNIVVAGSALEGGKKISDGVWESDDGQTTYILMGGDLIVGVRSAPHGTRVGTIVITGWQERQLGITLRDEEVPRDPPAHVYIGDYIKKTTPEGTYVFEGINYASDGASPGAADVLNGSIENDSIVGGGGNDGLSGFAGDDFIDAGQGDDLVFGGLGEDTIQGGAGNDEILGSGFGPVTQPASTSDTPPSSGGNPEIARGFGWAIYDIGNSYLVLGGNVLPVPETTGNIIDGGAGNDRIGAGTGSDTVHGGENDDVIVGMGASDVLFGDAGNDQMEGDGPSGDHGWSTVVSEHAGDYMDGDAGNDQMLGEGGDDVLFGDVDNDLLYGDDAFLDRTPLALHGNDYLDGEDGTDTLVGGGRDDEMFGGTGDDSLYGDGENSDQVTEDYDGNDYLDGEDGNDVLVGGGKADDLFGGEGNDTLLGDATWNGLAQQGNDYLDGEAGADQLRGYGGNDELFGGEGADTLQGDAGDDYLDGEADNDLLAAGDGNDTLYGGDGDDELQGANGDDVLTGETGEDKLFGEDGNDSLYGADGNDLLQGGNGDDLLSGDGEKDQLLGQDGNDSLYGGDATDLLVGDAGNDSLDAGSGNDELQGGTENDTLLGASGDDLLFGQAGDDSVDGSDGYDQLQGGDGTDWLAGGAGEDQVVGDAGDDALQGDDGRDELQGGVGNDSLDGGLDADILFGQAGGDMLDGGAGNDILQGDDGADTYVFGRGGGNDIIYNFETNGGAIDVLRISADVKSTDVIAWRDGLDQVYAIRGTDDSITVKNYYAATRGVTSPSTGEVTYFYDYRVEQVKFADGVTWTPADSPNFIQAKLGNGTTFSSTGMGNDVFAGTIAGDTFAGGYGSDTYLWSARSGRDTVMDGSRFGDVDTIRVDASIDPAEVDLVRSGNDAVLKLRGSPDEMVIRGGATAPAGLYKVVFEADGTSWLLSDRLAQLPASATLEERALPGVQQALAPQDEREGFFPLIALTGTSKADNLTGTAADDSLSGLGGADTLTGLAGNDTLDGGAGTDSLVGGLGDDTFVVDGASDLVVEALGEGVDTVKSSAAFTLGANVENLLLTGTSKINGTGNALANVLTGNTANNSLNGGAGDDTLVGGGGTDTLIGGTGNDRFVIDGSSDVITENASEGIDTAEASFNLTLAANLENLVLTGAATTGTGNAADNVLGGNALDNTLTGAAGADTMAGGAGNDTYVVADASDVIVEFADEGVDTVQSSISYTLFANVENLTLTGTAALNGTGSASANLLTGNGAANLLTGGDGNDTLDGGGGGADTLAGGLGDDTYVLTAATTIVENASEGNDTVRTSTSFTLAGGAIENLELTGTSAIDGTGDAGNNVITGNDGANVLDGGAGDDTLYGGAGNDTLHGDRTDCLRGGLGDDTYVFSGTPFSEWNSTTLEDAGAGTDTLMADGRISLVDSYYWSNVDRSYHYVGNVENAVLTGFANVNIEGNDGDNHLVGNGGNNQIRSWAGADTLDGAAGDDTLQGGNGSTLIGGEGNDRLEAQIWGSVLTMQGGAGDDYYYFYQGTGVITENAGQGIDTVHVVYPTGTFTLGANVENLVMSGGIGVGNALDNLMTSRASNVSGGAGSDTLDGTQTSAGVDTLAGGLGDDNFFISYDDVIAENANEGTDTVQVSFTYTLAANFENLTLTGLGSINGTGNAVANVLTGNAAANVLTGGAGDDIYVVGGGDSVVENVGEGNDTLRTSIGWSLAALANVENVELTGASDVNATGNAANNVLTGNVGANTLDGAAGADTLRGGAGNDVYIVDSTADVVVENAGEGTDTVSTAVTHSLAVNVENLVLTGSAQVNGNGNALENTLTGNSAANVLAGGAGNDTYVIDALDTVVEAAGEGTDTVQTSVSYTLGANVENLTLTGFNAVNGTGNMLANVLTGNNQVNALSGGAGNDTYFVQMGDTVIENAGEGTDTVRSYITWTLGANIENLVLLEGGIGADFDHGTGNDLANSLTGNRHANTLDGGAGADTLAGGQGNDTYVLDDAGDVVIENAGEGNDTIVSSVARVLGVDVENLVLSGTAAIDGTGNASANAITGNAAGNHLLGGGGDDTLDGGAGEDTLAGGLGDDVYVVADAGDVVIEAAGEGVDTVQTSVGGFALQAGIENLTLTGTGLRGDGNALDNVLASQSAAADTLAGAGGNDMYVIGAEDTVLENPGEGIDTVVANTNYTLGANIENLTLAGTANLEGTGNAQDNTLSGNAGANVLAGAAGDDTYVVGAGDSVLEGADDGHDTVRAFATHTLAANVEDLVLTGTAAIDGYGNAAANAMTGNSADNVLDGLGGADTLAGGAGNDTYYVRGEGVTIVEGAGEGVDLVVSTIDWTLEARLENLQLGGTQAVAGTGNALDNRITGNVRDNVLAGDAGNDTLDGGIGADTLAGGMGDDTFDVDSAGDVVLESAGEGVDTVRSRVDWTLGANVENLALAGYAATSAIGNALDNVITGSVVDNVIDGGAGADTMRGGAGDDLYFVDDLLDVVDEVLGANEGHDTVASWVSYALDAELENLVLLGTAALAGTGNSGANRLTGNAAGNVLEGGAGDDTMDGGGGADTLQGGSGRDTFIVDDVGDVIGADGQSGDGDLVISTINYVLGGDLENLRLEGAAGAGTGNALANVLIGNEQGNVLDGAAGADSLVGGLGDDLFVLNDSGDWVAEYADEGFDEVRASVSVTLAANVEVFTLTGSGSLAGTGNAGNNLLGGNTGDNLLRGGGGIDVLAGGGGNDTLAGSAVAGVLAGGSDADRLELGAGAEVILFNLADGADTLVTAPGAGGASHDDTISLGGVSQADIRLARAGDDLLLKVAGSDDSLRLQGWYASAEGQTIGTLQVVVDTAASGGSQPSGAKVDAFDFLALVSRFDARLAGEPGLADWAPSDADFGATLLFSSDTAAIGGSLAWRYAHAGGLDAAAFRAALPQVGDPAFGLQAQSLEATLPSEEPQTAMFTEICLVGCDA